MPYRNRDRDSHRRDEAATYTTALALAAAYGAVAWGITAIVLQRRDIVDER